MAKIQDITVKVKLDTTDFLQKMAQVRGALAPRRPFFSRVWVACVSIALCLAGALGASIAAAWFDTRHTWWSPTASTWCIASVFILVILAFVALCYAADCEESSEWPI